MTNSKIQHLDKNVVAQEKDILDGHLLGDGSVFKVEKNRKNCIYAQRCKEKEYLEYLVANTSFLFGQTITHSEMLDLRTGNTYSTHHVKSKSNEIFTEARNRWYPEGKKILPQDLGITERLLLRFYLDDGYYFKGSCYLATNDFCLNDVESLSNKISKYCNFELAIHSAGDKKKEQYKLYVGRKNFSEFLGIIGVCPVKCYSYKWGE